MAYKVAASSNSSDSTSKCRSIPSPKDRFNSVSSHYSVPSALLAAVLDVRRKLCVGKALASGAFGVSATTTPAIVGNDSVTTPDPQNQVAYLDLVNLEASVYPFYRRGAAYMMNDSTIQYIRTLKDENGRPLNVSKPAKDDNSAPFGTVNGYPVFPNPDMAPLGAGNACVAFGQLSKYVIRRAGPMRVLRLTEKVRRVSHQVLSRKKVPDVR